jgi:beta-galactosidase
MIKNQTGTITATMTMRPRFGVSPLSIHFSNVLLKEAINMTSIRLVFILSLLHIGGLLAQTTYKVNINIPEKEPIRGHLNLGGSNPAGNVVSVNSYYIEINNEPFFPVIGEFHYSRYPAAYWEESIQKMKQGGINVIATYVFWNIHERTEGTFDWSGNLNLRRFLELVEKNGLYAIVRLGPFCHGEMRNGGIPDWMYGRTFEIRSNDPDYLVYVDKLYAEIAKQIESKLYKYGGPVIGVQLENEYQHSAAPWEFMYPESIKQFTVPDRHASVFHEQISATDGVNPWAEYGKLHMAKLKEIAIKHGLDVPIYTATGWGNAAIVEQGSIPVTSAYVYPFWQPAAPSSFYIFKDIHAHPDYSPVSYQPELYPSIPAEVGPGIQIKYSRRPVADFKSVKPLMVRIIGSGSNGIGYYMYHGGSTPVFDGKFYNEEVNGLPRINYDFQAPIGQHGQTRYHYKSLRMLHMFLDSYGQTLAPMKTVLPETNASITPDDTKTLRYAVRSYGDTGFVFIVNYQDHMEMADINDVQIQILRENDSVYFPDTGSMNIPAATSAIFPFNLNLGNVTVQSATVQPLTTLSQEGVAHFVFSAINGIEPTLLFPHNTIITEMENASMQETPNGKRVRGDGNRVMAFTANGSPFVVLPYEMALNSVKIDEHLYVSEATLTESNGMIHIISRDESPELTIYPSHKEHPFVAYADMNHVSDPIRDMSSYQIRFKKTTPEPTVKRHSNRKYAITVDAMQPELNDLFLKIDYVGDTGMAFINGEMITDHFYHDSPWEIGLKAFMHQLHNTDMVFVFQPIYADYGFISDLKTIPEFTTNNYLQVHGFELIPEYRAILTP